MTELEIMKRAQMYIDSLAKGIDPISGHNVKEDDVVNNVRISRCLFYVSNVLQRVIDNGGNISAENRKAPDNSRDCFSLTAEQITSLVPDEKELSAAKITAKINTLIDTENMQKLTATALVSWLVSAGILCEITDPGGKKRKIPTDAGKALGIREAVFHDAVKGDVRYNVYDKNAQQFIFDNLDPITEVCREEYGQKAQLKQQQTENKGKPWSAEEDECLAAMFRTGNTLKEMTVFFKRTGSSVKARLIKLGLTERADGTEQISNNTEE